jgi:ribonuclease P protein component
MDADETQAPQTEQNAPRAVFRRRHRLTGGDFGPVFAGKLRKSRGVLTVHLRPNGLSEHRLGLSIGRRLGNAVTRGRFKRAMREVFRLHRGSLPMGVDGGAYDIVVTTRPHEPLTHDAYRSLFLDAVEAAHRVHAKRSKTTEGSDA